MGIFSGNNIQFPFRSRALFRFKVQMLTFSFKVLQSFDSSHFHPECITKLLSIYLRKGGISLKFQFVRWNEHEPWYFVAAYVSCRQVNSRRWQHIAVVETWTDRWSRNCWVKKEQRSISMKHLLSWRWSRCLNSARVDRLQATFGVKVKSDGVNWDVNDTMITASDRDMRVYNLQNTSCSALALPWIGK